MEFEIFTWGSCRFGEVKILYPEAVNEEKLHALTRRSGRVELSFAVLEVENSDSSKNIKRKVKILPKTEIIVRYYGKASCSKSFDEIYLIKINGEVEELSSSIKQEITEVEEGKYKKEYLVRFLEYNGKKIEISREELKREVIPEKLEVIITTKDGKTIISGDTYQIRSLLKTLKFKWDGRQRVWYREGNDYGEIQLRLEGEGIKVIVDTSQEKVVS